MKILVATDAHVFVTPDGKHWSKAIYGYSFWKRYLNVFDRVKVVARTKKVNEKPENSILIDGPGVEIYPISFYQGPKQLITKYFKIKNELKNVEDDCDVALFRMPSQTAQMAFSSIKKKMPIGGEIVYDPTDDLKRDGNIFLKILNYIISNNLKRFCKIANGVSYVTSETIQKNYPSTARIYGKSKNYFETSYSTIVLDKENYTGERNYEKKKKFVLCMSDVSMNSDRKGETVFIKTLKKVKDKGYDISATIIGDGSKKIEYENLAKDLGIYSSIRFTGRLSSSKEVREELIKSDILFFPTQAEGLPRGILEAMAVGMPVLSTPVGGIPEIIEKKYLFEPDDIDSFSNAICNLLENPSELNKMSRNNFKKSLEFSNEILQQKRDIFYKKLKELSSDKRGE